MSRPINEEAPLADVAINIIAPCLRECGHCDKCVRYIRAMSPGKVVTEVTPVSIKSRAEFYQVALREEGEAREALYKAETELAKAQEALCDASAQLTLTREGLFKACGL